MEENKSYELLSDRVKSIVERWDKFYDSHKELNNVNELCVNGMLQELNDGFTKSIVDSSKQ